MTGVLISLICSNPDYSAVCRHTINAGGQQSGLYHFIDDKQKELVQQLYNIAGEDIQYVGGLGVLAWRLNNNRIIFREIKNVPFCDSLRFGISKTSGQIELRWEL